MWKLLILLLLFNSIIYSQQAFLFGKIMNKKVTYQKFVQGGNPERHIESGLIDLENGEKTSSELLFSDFYEVRDSVNKIGVIYNGEEKTYALLNNQLEVLRITKPFRTITLGLFQFSKFYFIHDNGKVKFLDQHLKLIESKEYDEVWGKSISNDPTYIPNRGAVMIAVEKGNKWALLDKNLEPVTPFDYDAIYPNDGDFPVWFLKKNNKYLIFNETLDTLGELKENLRPFQFNNGLLTVRDEEKNKYGVINLKNETLIPFNYEGITQKSADIFVVWTSINGQQKIKVINLDGVELPDTQIYKSNISENIFWTKSGNKEFFIDKDGKQLFNEKFDRIYFSLYHGFPILVRTGNEFKYILQNGSYLKIPSLLGRIFGSRFDGEYASVDNGHGSGIINKKGEFVIAPQKNFFSRSILEESGLPSQEGRSSMRDYLRSINCQSSQ